VNMCVFCVCLGWLSVFLCLGMFITRLVFVSLITFLCVVRLAPFCLWVCSFVCV